MCGVAGIFDARGATLEDVRGMVQQIMYRGPDEWDAHKVGPALLGHARLAVVDPENGSQPMYNTDKSVAVVFNGEIYNHVELREELKAKGYQFKSRCDTEVLVHLWREEGIAMLDRLIGMFTFFIWDSRENRGILARDRFGIKPCFIADYKGGLAFCSEMKGLLSLPDFPRHMNYDALVQTFAFNYCPPPQTCFKGITQLAPGTYLALEPGKPPVQHRYWTWPFHETRTCPDLDEFEDLFKDAVRMQVDFDVKGGLYLSGGIDSSVVAAHLVKQWKEPRLNAFGLDFLEQGYSEYAFAEEVANKFGINLEKAEIDYKMIPELAEKVIFHTEQPHGDFSFYLFYILARRAHQKGKIVLFSGDGPDEALFGFSHNTDFFNNITRTNFSLRSYFNKICYMDENFRQRVLEPECLRGSSNPLDTFESILEPWRDLEPIEQIMAYECTSLMPGNNLVKGDRMGACWSTEGRSPYLDHRIMETFVKLPLSEKMEAGVGKKYLKFYAERFFSKQFIYEKKRMPTTPIGNWLQGPLHGWAHDVLSMDNQGIFKKDVALELLKEHQSGKVNHTRPLRTLIMASLWVKTFFK